MHSIELIVNEDVCSTNADLYCGECTTEILVGRTHADSYKHPNYNEEWDIAYHEYHNIRLLHPHLIAEVLDTIESYACPICSSTGKLLVLDNTEFDSQFVLKSLKEEEDKEYECGKCSQVFYSHKDVIVYGKIYLCSDCVALA